MMTKTRIKLAALPLLALIVGLLGAWAAGGSLWSVLGGFVSSALVILASWQHAFAKVQNALQSDAAVALAHEMTARHDEALAEALDAQKDGESGQADSDTTSKKPARLAFFARSFRGGAGLFVAPFRLGAYVLLVAIFLALLRHEVFGIFSFLFGSFLALGSLLVCLLIDSKTRD